MKLQPQDWSLLTDIQAVRRPRQPAHSPQPIDALRAADTRVPDKPSTPAAATAPAGLVRLVQPPLGVLLLAVGLVAGWLLAGHGGQGSRGGLVGAGAAAALMLPILLYYFRHARASAAETAVVRQQVANILGCVHEGLFLIGRDLRLRAPCSGSLTDLLSISAPCGQRFEDVFRPLLDAETLAAALTFLRLLWNDQTDEDAIESVNPLSQIEMCFANTHGGSERRCLSFSFRRATAGGFADDCIVAVVADVTDKVLLARELEQTKADGDSQPELLLQLVRTDPLALVAFLDDADTAFRKSNALLTAPGIGSQQMQRKLNGVLRELHAVTAQAEMLPLASFAQRLRRIDDLLSGLCAKTSLTGNDFLPVVIRLDELMSHAATMRVIHTHIVLLRAASAALAALEHRESTVNIPSSVLELS
jgi:hypothetical protein